MIVGLLGGGVVGVIFKTVIDYLTRRREHSGRVTSTPAEQLWAERVRISDEQRARIEALEQRLASSDALREQEHQDVLALHEKYGALEEAHRRCKQDLANLGAEVRKK